MSDKSEDSDGTHGSERQAWRETSISTDGDTDSTFSGLDETNTSISTDNTAETDGTIASISDISEGSGQDWVIPVNGQYYGYLDKSTASDTSTESAEVEQDIQHALAAIDLEQSSETNKDELRGGAISTVNYVLIASLKGLFVHDTRLAVVEGKVMVEGSDPDFDRRIKRVVRGRQSISGGDYVEFIVESAFYVIRRSVYTAVISE
jgi:hypothetical protein